MTSPTSSLPAAALRQPPLAAPGAGFNRNHQHQSQHKLAVKFCLQGGVHAAASELSSTAGVALQQAHDGGVALGSLDELLQRQLSYKTKHNKREKPHLKHSLIHPDEVRPAELGSVMVEHE